MATAPTNEIAIIASEDTNSSDYSTKLTPRDEIFTYGFQIQFLAYEELNYLFNNHGNWLDYLNDSVDELTDTTDSLQTQITNNDNDISDLQDQITSNDTDISSLQDSLEELETYVGSNTSNGSDSELVSGIFEGIYPVGTIYSNYSTSANPNTYLLAAENSTWVAIAGRVILGAGTGTDDNSYEQTFTAGETGGEYVHTQTADELVAHIHGIDIETDSDGEHFHRFELGGNGEEENEVGPSMNDGWLDQYFTTSVAYGDTTQGAHHHSISGDTESTGGGSAMNNIQPYYVAYTWRRTA